ncbi:MAG: hypothetical protein JW748_00010 [Anaerolineales bacterium]|nr:hypothetical protein [Anaerolineales bacterium]
MKTESSRRMFLQAGLSLPAAAFVIPPGILEAALQQPGKKKPPVFQEPSGYPDTGKYGKYVIKEPYAKYHQLENVTVSPRQLMADCIITHQVFYKPEVIIDWPHKHDFVEIIACLGTNPMDCREFDAEIEWCLGEEREPHLIRVPTVVSMVKGLYHGPIEIKKINKPFIFLEVMLTSGYGAPIMLPKPKAGA